MKTNGHLHFVFAVAGISAILAGCGSRQSGEEPLTPANASAPSPAAPAESTEDEARPCQSTEDCGPGYVCGFDHARSHVIRQCM